MKSLTTRQKRILSLIVHEHIASAEPVGSKSLVQKYGMGLSSATVRNEMAALTEEGLLRQPYTSAGRIPTEEGYRYFVRQLMNETYLPSAMRATINHQFSQMSNDIQQWMRLAASVLANQTNSASLITAPQASQVQFKHLELIATHGRQILVILVLEGGQIRQNILSLDEPVSQDELSVISRKFSHLLAERYTVQISDLQKPLTANENQILAWIEDEMTRSDNQLTGDIVLDGLTNVLSKPEFADSEEARRSLRLLEERSLLQDLLSQTILPDTIGGVQVLIGGEGTWDDLRQWSVILSKYGSPNMATGTIGVLGPMRMPYGQSISLVRFLSGLLSDLVIQQW
ncbi:MAG: heat-inducible transcription repressor HrcA [Anaerolineaceae bacterium]|nr:heat-inducible transcription repressor HrcA [Anaerolineaceae bacterium]